MLTENTGAHILDSGGAYGRHWERNQKKSIEDFQNDYAVRYDVNTETGDIERTVSVFHLLANLELDEICDQFNKLNNKASDWDGDLYGVSKKAQRYLNEIEVEVEREFNTYNGDSDLTQTMQGANLKIFNDGQNESYVLLQIHNGCDVRGGYTDAKLFKVTDEYYNTWEYMPLDEIIDNGFYDGEVIDQHGNVLNGDQLEAFIETYHELA